MVDLVTPSAGLDALHRKTGVGADVRSLRALAIGAGLISAILFVVVGIAYQLQSYGDGSIFSYAIAAEDAWDPFFVGSASINGGGVNGVTWRDG